MKIRLWATISIQLRELRIFCCSQPKKPQKTSIQQGCKMVLDEPLNAESSTEHSETTSKRSQLFMIVIHVAPRAQLRPRERKKMINCSVHLVSLRTWRHASATVSPGCTRNTSRAAHYYLPVLSASMLSRLWICLFIFGPSNSSLELATPFVLPLIFPLTQL